MRRVVPVLALAAACGSDEVLLRTSFPLAAFCQADVIGVGLLEVETDYLAHVVTCENGGASLEALKAQAVSARSYLYYKLESQGSVADGTGDQVYTCGRAPGPEHMQAVLETSGLVLRYMDTQVAAFYVAGARNQAPPACVGSVDDPTGTEQYVTYNQGKSGDGLEQTTLGFVSPGNFANRGCMSQNGADCLSDDGHDFRDILRFYYGEDIVIEQAVGPCVVPVAGTIDAGVGADVDAGAGGGEDDGGVFGGCGVGGRSAGVASGLWLLLALGAVFKVCRIPIGSSRACQRRRRGRMITSAAARPSSHAA